MKVNLCSRQMENSEQGKLNIAVKYFVWTFLLNIK